MSQPKWKLIAKDTCWCAGCGTIKVTRPGKEQGMWFLNESKSGEGMKISSDKINSGFEIAGGFFIVLSILQVLQDKSVAGVNLFHIAFFVIWGYWNLYYYASIKQKWSLRATFFITAVNTVWLALLIYYKLRLWS